MKVTDEMCSAAWEALISESPCWHAEMRPVLEAALADLPDVLSSDDAQFIRDLDERAFVDGSLQRRMVRILKRLI